MSTIGTLSSEVLVKVENRTNDTTRAYQWLKEALLEITANPDLRNDFPELEDEGPNYNLTIGQSEYADSNFIDASQVNRATLTIRLWIDPPTNTKWIMLNPSHYQKTDRTYMGNARPVEWFRFGTNIGFWPPPDVAYQARARYLRQHPIDGTVQNTTILLTADWDEVLVLGAAMRGFIELEQYEKAEAIRKTLYGDPKYPEKPGMVFGRKTRRESEAHRVTQALTPRLRRYVRR